MLITLSSVSFLNGPGNYKFPLHVSCVSCILGMILYATAYKARWLYLILIGRCVVGGGFSMFMYAKRYCTDPRIVGMRRRTTLASWLVIGQGIGISLGPFAGGLLYKIGFPNDVFNGYTSPGWVMAIVWCIFWAAMTYWFEDPPAAVQASNDAPEAIEMTNNLIPASDIISSETSASTAIASSSRHINPLPAPTQTSSSLAHSNSMLVIFRRMTLSQWGVTACMCWFAMTCFFVLGAWESNLPVFGADFEKFHWTPFSAGNFLALGGVTAFPFLVLNLFVARRIQDRKILAFGTGLGGVALFIFLSLLKTNKLSYGTAFVCWWAVALGFNVASTVTFSLLSKQLPPAWNSWSSMAIQYSNYAGRVTGAVWGGSGVLVGMSNYVGLEIAFVGIGALLFTSFWRDLKAKTG